MSHIGNAQSVPLPGSGLQISERPGYAQLDLQLGQLMGDIPSRKYDKIGVEQV
jgi:hypothetical protein